MARGGWYGTVGNLAALAWVLGVVAPLDAQARPAPARPSPQTAGGLPMSDGAGLTLRRLVRMSPRELEQLYAQGCTAPIPPGKIRGQALMNPGTRLAVPASGVSRLVWQGKIFQADGRTAVNQFFGVRMIKAEVYDAESWRDGRPALILDYSRTSRLYAPYRDEIRQIAPGLFLGLMFDRTVCPPNLKMYFALECLPHP